MAYLVQNNLQKILNYIVGIASRIVVNPGNNSIFISVNIKEQKHQQYNRIEQ